MIPRTICMFCGFAEMAACRAFQLFDEIGDILENRKCNTSVLNENRVHKIRLEQQSDFAEVGEHDRVAVAGFLEYPQIGPGLSPIAAEGSDRPLTLVDAPAFCRHPTSQKE